MAKLKINVKSLAEEARINRREASRFSGEERWELNHHRTYYLRRESRVAQLAYAYLRGKPRAAMDNKAEVNWQQSSTAKRISEKIKRITCIDVPHEEIIAWLATG